MRKFRCTVNGNAYDVEVEELTAGVPAAPAAPAATAPAAKPAAAPAPKAKTAGKGEKVKSPMPGTILDVKVSEGAAVKKDDVIIVLEAMKMENDIVAPCDGTITSILVKKGDSVNSADTLATVG
jgi:biotin carboxyl carrier protein